MPVCVATSSVECRSRGACGCRRGDCEGMETARPRLWLRASDGDGERPRGLCSLRGDGEPPRGLCSLRGDGEGPRGLCSLRGDGERPGDGACGCPGAGGCPGTSLPLPLPLPRVPRGRVSRPNSSTLSLSSFTHRPSCTRKRVGEMTIKESQCTTVKLTSATSRSALIFAVQKSIMTNCKLDVESRG